MRADLEAGQLWAYSDRDIWVIITAVDDDGTVYGGTSGYIGERGALPTVAINRVVMAKDDPDELVAIARDVREKELDVELDVEALEELVAGPGAAEA